MKRRCIRTMDNRRSEAVLNLKEDGALWGIHTFFASCPPMTHVCTINYCTRNYILGALLHTEFINILRGHQTCTNCGQHATWKTWLSSNQLSTLELLGPWTEKDSKPSWRHVWWVWRNQWAAWCEETEARYQEKMAGCCHWAKDDWAEH